MSHAFARREFLRSSAAALLGSALTSHSRTEAADSTLSYRGPVIDTHTHFYDPTRPQGVPWPPKDLAPLYRRVTPTDWMSLANPLGIHQTIVVEASPWVEDNQWLLDLAAREACIVGVCGNLDAADAAFGANLKRFAANPIFRGIRWRSDLVRIDAQADHVRSGARLLADYGLELDLNGPVEMLAPAARLAADVPDLRIVVDHLGGPGDPRSPRAEWRDGVDLVAAQPNVFMKVSALVEQVPGTVGPAPTEMGYYLPVLDHLWECFGEDRLIYGSNWPVSDRRAPYDVMFSIVRNYFASKGPAALEKFFWKNSVSAYQWRERSL